MKSDLLISLNEARSERRPVAVITDLTSGETRLVENPNGDVLADEINARLRSGKSGIIDHQDKDVFIQVYVPPPRLIIIGAVHISQALVPMAQACNFDVTVVDPRTAFATQERFAGIKLRAEWPDEIPDVLALDPFTALVAVTHDPKIDDIPLRAALAAGCFYIGALGSRKTHAKRLERLADLDEKLQRIHAPIGLDIGAASPAEIAVAVMAEIIANLRKGERA